MGNKRDGIFTVATKSNSQLIKMACDLYCKPGDRIADVTYGKGNFWGDDARESYEIVGSDLAENLASQECQGGIDFRCLPYENQSFSHSVIDPPYARIDYGYMNNSYRTSKEVTHANIMNLYFDGLKELKRITKDKGYIFCKCQDEIEGCVQKMSHIEIHDYATKVLGLKVADLFVYVNPRATLASLTQKHARKNHSYLWVFQVRHSNRTRRSKELHVYFKTSDLFIRRLPNVALTYQETLEMLERDEMLINTTQTTFVKTEWISKGYKIFAHLPSGEVVNIKLGTDNKYTNKDIRLEHNLERLLLAGKFGKIA